MHELFITAVVPDADIERAKALLQGLTGMTARGSLHRLLYFAGPPQPRGLTVKRGTPLPIQPAQGRVWAELYQQMVRQSFVLQARYPVNVAELGATPAASPGSAAILAGSAPGTLRWTDLPDPTGGNNATGIVRLATQRKKLELVDMRNLPAILTENGYRCVFSFLRSRFARFVFFFSSSSLRSFCFFLFLVLASLVLFFFLFLVLASLVLFSLFFASLALLLVLACLALLLLIHTDFPASNPSSSKRASPSTTTATSTLSSAITACPVPHPLPPARRPRRWPRCRRGTTS